MSSEPRLDEPTNAFFADVNGTTLRVWEWGDPAGLPVLAVHGAFDHGRMWDELAPRVAALGFRVWAIDQRGHGDSGRVETGQIFRQSVVDLGCLAELAGQPVGLLGHSMGSSMSIGAAAVWPERFRWVVSLDGLGPPNEIFAAVPIRETATNMVDYAVKSFGRDLRVFPSKEAMAEQRGAINRRVPARWLSHLVEFGSIPNGDGWSWKWDPTFNVNMPDGFRLEVISGEFRRMTRPILVLTGAEDDMWSDMPAEQIEERLGWLAHSRHVAVAGGGHYLHLEEPDVVFGHITDFLRDQGELAR